MNRDMTERQARRLEVVRRYHQYVDALRRSALEGEPVDVQTARRALARSIEVACLDDDFLLDDFRRAFASRPRS